MLFGSDVANAQPVVMKYLYLARKERDAQVAVVNPFREPGPRALLGAVQRRERHVRDAG